AIVGGSNYGQGSSREHAAIAPRYLGLRVVIAKSFARIHWQNLVNFGILPLTFDDEQDHQRLTQETELKITGIHEALANGNRVDVHVDDGDAIVCRHGLSQRQVDVWLAGG